MLRTFSASVVERADGRSLEALIVPYEDETALINALRETIGNREATLERMRAARLRVETDLSFDTRLRKVEAIYDRLASTRT